MFLFFVLSLSISIVTYLHGYNTCICREKSLLQSYGFYWTKSMAILRAICNGKVWVYEGIQEAQGE